VVEVCLISFVIASSIVLFVREEEKGEEEYEEGGDLLYNKKKRPPQKILEIFDIMVNSYRPIINQYIHELI